MKLSDVLITLPDDTYFEVTKNNSPTICTVLDRHKVKGGKTSKIVLGTVTERDLRNNGISINDRVICYEYHPNDIHRIEVEDYYARNY